MGIVDVAKKANITVKQARAVFAAIACTDEPTIIRGFGTFRLKTRAARKGRNPQTGETITIPEKTVMTFKAN